MDLAASSRRSATVFKRGYGDYSGGMSRSAGCRSRPVTFKVGPASGLAAPGSGRARAPTTGEPSFDTLLFKAPKPGRSRTAASRGPGPERPDPDSWVGLFLKVGYLWTPSDRNWTMSNGTKLWSGPALHSSGALCRLAVDVSAVRATTRTAR